MSGRARDVAVALVVAAALYRKDRSLFVGTRD